MIEIKLLPKTGEFAENKDVARSIRTKKLEPALEKNQEVILDFTGVDGTTQSFIHALMSDAIRKYGGEVFDRITFKDCTPSVRNVISIVAEYMQSAI